MALSALAPEPTLLSIARLGRGSAMPPGGADLYRHIARLVELGPGDEFVVVPSGPGLTTELLADHSGAAGSGVDPDPGCVELARARARQKDLTERLHYEHASPNDLPYQDAVFDLAIGEMGVAAEEDPATAVRELVRVTKPMGSVVLLQLVWTRQMPDDRRAALIDHLGVRPLLLVEWKQLLRDAGVVELYVDDWSESVVNLSNPFGFGSGERGSVVDKLSVLYHSWNLWGWRGVRGAMLRERELRDLIGRERVLGLSLIKGTKWDPEAVAAG